jgi:rhodanese-related sulfurtransferase
MTNRNRTSLQLACFVLALVGAPAAESAANPAQKISSQQALSQQQAGDGFVFLDVRTPEEFASGRVPGAVNIPVGQLSSRLAELEKDDRLVVYCERGPRAAIAAGTLLEAGYTNVSHLTGDMAGWRAAGLPIEK